MTKKEKIKQERTELCKQVITYFNEKADRKFRYSNRQTLKFFTAEWSHQYGLPQYKGVIDYLVLRWKGDHKMEAYLRPATIFGPEKFPEYLDEARNRIRAERQSKRLKPFSTYSPVEQVDDKQLKPFNQYRPEN